MIDFLAFIIGFFLISLLVLIISVGVKFLYKLVTIGQAKNNYREEIDRQLSEDSKEDSEGDGLMLFDDPLFPEESE